MTTNSSRASRDLASAVKLHGARVALQLGHHGNNASHPRRQEGFPPGDQVVVGPSPVAYIETGVIPHELTRDEIRELVAAFASAALRAKEAGFDAVEFHGAHGKLISQFLSPYYNRRTDEYGGSVANRARFGSEILAAARRKVGPDFPLIMRMDGWDGYEGGFSLEEAVATAPLFVAAGADALHVSAGASEATHRQFLTYLQESGALVHLAEAVRKVGLRAGHHGGQAGGSPAGGRGAETGQGGFHRPGPPPDRRSPSPEQGPGRPPGRDPQLHLLQQLRRFRELQGMVLHRQPVGDAGEGVRDNARFREEERVMVIGGGWRAWRRRRCAPSGAMR